MGSGLYRRLWTPFRTPFISAQSLSEHNVLNGHSTLHEIRTGETALIVRQTTLTNNVHNPRPDTAREIQEINHQNYQGYFLFQMRH
jgi:hypothetical protein